MADALDPLVLDLVEWVAKAPRPYAEVMEAWQTSCPRLSVWEEAVDRGYISRESVPDRGTVIVATAAGRRFLRAVGREPIGTLGPEESAGRD
jgi:hypothetical protein